MDNNKRPGLAENMCSDFWCFFFGLDVFVGVFAGVCCWCFFVGVFAGVVAGVFVGKSFCW